MDVCKTVCKTIFFQNVSCLVIDVPIWFTVHVLPYLKYSFHFVAMKILFIVAERNRVISYKHTWVLQSLSTYSCNDSRSLKIYLQPLCKIICHHCPSPRISCKVCIWVQSGIRWPISLTVLTWCCNLVIANFTILHSQSLCIFTFYYGVKNWRVSALLEELSWPV